MIIFGLVFLLLGFFLQIPFLWSLGVIALIVGLVLWTLGALGHAVAGRRHFY